jgi:hypothetical protein
MSVVSFLDRPQKLKHCSSCGCEHMSAHFHVIKASDRHIVRERFPGLGDRWATFGAETELRLCCLWFADEHGHRVHDLASQLAQQAPRSDAAPRREKRILPNVEIPDDEEAGQAAASQAKKRKAESLQPSPAGMNCIFEKHSSRV